jgi:hypothetical protein
MAPIGLRMFRKGKLKLLPEQAKGRKEIQGIFYRLEDEKK